MRVSVKPGTGPEHYSWNTPEHSRNTLEQPPWWVLPGTLLVIKISQKNCKIKKILKYRQWINKYTWKNPYWMKSRKQKKTKQQQQEQQQIQEKI